MWHSKGFWGAAGYALALSIAVGTPALAKDKERDFFEGLDYRNIGPFRGGRVTAVAGVASDPHVYYMGSVGGGVWKTTNAGESWKNVSDEYFQMGSVGAIDVAPSDPNVVVVGMGESPFRGVASGQGDGVYKSTDSGKTWKQLGLAATRQISSVKVHPENPDVIWVGAQGDIWAPSKDRGVYKSTDGGATWRKVLAGPNDTTGVVDLKYDLSNPRILYAAMWDHQRKPWEVRSGGPGSSIWKSSDGGETWEKLDKNLPKLMGKIGVAPSPAKPGRVWALVEAEEKGGLYRSEDGGENWTLVNGTREIQARSWYYMHVFADPQDENTVYVQNAPFKKSVDGGKTFTTIPGQHGDHHNLWINPKQPRWMIDGNDGGAAVTFDGGQTWSSIYNQPTAQFYRVNTDNDFFYRVYAGQQDNSTVSVLSRAPDGSIGAEDFKAVGGCESAHVAFNPDDPRYIYAGCYLGQIDEFDGLTETVRDINPYPELAFGVAPRERKHRFNWNAPILVSRHDPKAIYHGGERLLKSTDRGFSWREISPDLTRNDPEKQGRMGGPITNEVTENYNTILAVAESPQEKGTIWVGSDDGLVHLTRDDGGAWANVTPKGVGEAMINAIEVSPHRPGTAFVAVTRYKLGDRTPLIYRTDNYGATWRQIAKGFAAEDFVRVVREDSQRPGMLFAGTETGVYVSFNDGQDWRRLQLDLPRVPVTDIKVHGHDLVLSTQGRAFWILDDISPLRQYSSAQERAGLHLFAPEPAYRIEFAGSSSGGPTASNPPNGAVIYYALAQEPDLEKTTITLEVLDAAGKVLRTLKTDKEKGVKGGGGGSAYKLPAEKGINRVVWNLRREHAPKVEGFWQIGGGEDQLVDGPMVGPGRYTLRLTMGETVLEQPLELRWDPRVEVSPEATAEQQALTLRAFAQLEELHRAIAALQNVKGQAERRKKLAEEAGGKDDPLVKAADEVMKGVDAWIETVATGKREGFQDVLNWPDKLHSDLQQLIGTLDGANAGVTQGMRERLADLELDLRTALAGRDAVVNGPIAAFNAAFRSANAPGLVMPALGKPADSAVTTAAQ